MRRISVFIAALITAISLIATVMTPAASAAKPSKDATSVNTTTAAAAIPAGRQIEAEDLGLGTWGWKWGATRWSAVLMGMYNSASKPLPQGSFEVTVRTSGVGAVRILVDHTQVAEYNLSDLSSWRELTTVVNTQRAQGTLSFFSLGDVWVDWVQVNPVTPQLTTRGNRIIGPDGAAIKLHGVNKDGLETKPEGWYMYEGDVAAIKSWGADIVRIPVSQMFWLSESCAYDPAYRSRVDDLVEWVTSRGMYALIDLHRTGNGKTCGQNVNAAAPDQLSVTFWEQAAARYANHPLVAFHLFNEPQDITASTWLSGGLLGLGQAVGMQQLYDTVRSTGARNLVFVSGTGWAIDLLPALTNRVQGYGIVLAPHLYNNGFATVSQWADDLVLGAAAQYPVVITEFGSTTHPPQYSQAVIDWAQAHDLSGWIAWVWSAGSAGSTPIPDDGYALLAKPHGQHQPSEVGKVVKAALASS